MRTEGSEGSEGGYTRHYSGISSSTLIHTARPVTTTPLTFGPTSVFGSVLSVQQSPSTVLSSLTQSQEKPEPVSFAEIQNVYVAVSGESSRSLCNN